MAFGPRFNVPDQAKSFVLTWKGNSMSAIDITQEKTTTHPLPQVKPLIHRIWPQAIVGLALSATTVWTCLLAYGFVRLILVAI
jgi:hypothetical protein